MEKLNRISAILIVVMFIAIPAKAQWQLVFDPTVTAAVIKNTGTQAAVENLQNTKLDSIKSQKEKTARFTTTMAVITEVYKEVMQNYRGFGAESQYYIQIGESAMDIVQRLPKVIRAVNHADIAGKASVLLEVGNLYTKTYSLVSDFINIVNNGHVRSPIDMGTGGRITGDGYNFLDRYDRLQVAVKILTDIDIIKYKVIYLEWLANTANWESLFRTILPQDWCAMMEGTIRVNYVIDMWRRL